MACGTRRDLKQEAFWRRIARGQSRGQLAVRESASCWWRTQLARRDIAAPTFVPARVSAESFLCLPGRDAHREHRSGTAPARPRTAGCVGFVAQRLTEMVSCGQICSALRGWPRAVRVATTPRPPGRTMRSALEDGRCVTEAIAPWRSR